MNSCIAIKSCMKSWMAGEHNAIRETWGNYPDLRFFYGAGAGWMLGPSHDEIFLPVPDDYERLPLKVHAICQWAVAPPSEIPGWGKADYDFAWLADNDTYCSIPRLLASGYEAHDYIGYRLEGKDYASGGAGYWLSKKAMQIVAACDASRFTAEDEMVGTVLKEAGIKLHHDPRYALYRDVLPSNDVISRHLSSRGPYQIEFMYAAHRLAHP